MMLLQDVGVLKVHITGTGWGQVPLSGQCAMGIRVSKCSSGSSLGVAAKELRTKSLSKNSKARNGGGQLFCSKLPVRRGKFFFLNAECG